jgi:protein SCO1/2
MTEDHGDPGAASPPGGIPSGGIGPLAAAAVLLVLAGGALVVSRSSLRPEPVPSCCERKDPAGGGQPAPAAADAGAEGREDAPLPVLGEVPDFSFTERSGRAVARKDLMGRVWVADFIFTSCVGTCPEMSLRMAGVHEALRKDSDALCVSFSVDPERDSLEALRAYADRFSATADRWLFLRGPQDAVHRLEYGGFKMGDPTDALVHSERFVLVDRRGRIRGWYHGVDDAAVKDLLRDSRRIGQERP